MMQKYDAIVVGSGITGGWAAKELCERGLKTLLLERGRDLKHGDYLTAQSDSWDLPNGGKLTREELEHYPVQRRSGYVDQATRHLWVQDNEHPYHEESGFDWIRGNHVGGRSLTWGRQVYRWSDLDFEANAKEGIGVDWPIRYKDLAPWYDYVEKFIGVSGRSEGLQHLPDGSFLPAMEMNCIETYLTEQIRAKYTDRIVTIGRVANLTIPHLGRGTCQYRDRCIRGCPFGAYFSSQSSTLPAAFATGLLDLRPHSVVKEIIFDEGSELAKGVRIIDAETMEEEVFESDLIFLNASTLATAQILLQSKSNRFPNGLGNDSGQLGKNLMDHHCYAGAQGQSDLFPDKYYKGRRANGIYVPRFRNTNAATATSKYKRGFAYQGAGAREGWSRSIPEARYGAKFKEAALRPGKWTLGLIGFGECLPYENNQISLHPSKKDGFGLPQISIDMRWQENELAMRADMMTDAQEMMEKAGFKNIRTFDQGKNPGSGIHEMGTARMGKSAETSVLNAHNQMHGVRNVFVTDGACMTSSACQNPSLTYMALTVRAVSYAVDLWSKKALQ